MITSRTKLCGLIGDPVEHTLSPAMHNAAIEYLGLDYVYLAFRVNKTGLAAAIQGMKALGMRGLNVTIPHKVSIIPFLDELDGLAKDIGAVNTIVNDSGKLKGYNTDSGGFMQALLKAGISLQGKRVVLLGAGGAARAAGFALAQKDSRLTILNRKEELDQAEALARRLSQTIGSEAIALELSEANLRAALRPAHLLVNATSVGMSPKIDETPVPQKLLRPTLKVFDIVYSPLKTRLLREAEAQGCQTISGLEMLVEQGALALELWTGEKAPADIMREAALAALGASSTTSATKQTQVPPGLKNSVALIGFMGAGKSSAGKALAQKMGKRFVELDSLIEKRAGKSINRIFNEDGETSFREFEMDAVREVSTKPGQIIACGGGVVLNRINIDRLKARAVLIYLKVSAKSVRQRVATAAFRRPLLNVKDKSKAIDELMAFREPLYEHAADITLDTSKLSIRATVNKIIDMLKQYEGFNF